MQRKKTTYLLVSLSALMALPCYSQQPLPLPVTKKQLVKDWTLASYEGYVPQELPHYYQCVDLDLDGNPEVLLMAENQVGGPRAMLFYRNGRLQDFLYGSDGYDELALGEPKHDDGLVVATHDDHGGEFRVWDMNYYRVSGSTFELIGSKVISRAPSEDGEDYDYENSGDAPAAVTELPTTDISQLEGWIPLNLTADDKAAARQVKQSDHDGFIFLRKAIGEGTMTYRGKIGTYPITMFVGVDTDGDFACYYYDSRPYSVFRLKATSNMGDPRGWNDVVLNEYTQSGKHTGTFTGRIQGRGDGFTGKFVNSKGREFDFELHQVAPVF